MRLSTFIELGVGFNPDLAARYAGRTIELVDGRVAGEAAATVHEVGR